MVPAKPPPCGYLLMQAFYQALQMFSWNCNVFFGNPLPGGWSGPGKVLYSCNHLPPIQCGIRLSKSIPLEISNLSRQVHCRLLCVSWLYQPGKCTCHKAIASPCWHKATFALLTLLRTICVSTWLPLPVAEVPVLWHLPFYHFQFQAAFRQFLSESCKCSCMQH